MNLIHLYQNATVSHLYSEGILEAKRAFVDPCEYRLPIPQHPIDLRGLLAPYDIK